MITHLDIKNFKSLKSVSTPVKNLNLLMGLNGMGKTSFLQTLLLLMQSQRLEEQIIDLNGPLAEIGQGRDALYQYAKDDYIDFGIQFNQQQAFQWKLEYETTKDKLKAITGYKASDMKFFKQQMQHFQYISAERIGPRSLHEASSVEVEDKRELGLLGEFAVYYINVFGDKYRVQNTLQHSNKDSSSLKDQINTWLKEISPGVLLNTRFVPDINKVILDYQFELPGARTNAFNPKNVGFGISYVLPVVLALLTAEPEKIIIIENPESHIHPRGQAELGKLIALAAQSGAQVFIETHSDHILNGVRVAVKEQQITQDKVNILYFDKVTNSIESYTQLHQIKVDRNGTLSKYPDNLLDEWSNLMAKLI